MQLLVARAEFLIVLSYTIVKEKKELRLGKTKDYSCEAASSIETRISKGKLMIKFIACLVAVAAISLTTGETQAQFYRGGSGVSIGFGGGGFNRGFSSFNRGFNRSGVSINIGNGFNRGFGGYGYSPVYRGGGFYSSGVRYARPVYYSPVYRGGGYYGGGAYRGRSCGY